MKFQQAAAFEKHLQEAFPHHLSRVYMVVSPFDDERKQWLEEIASILRRREEVADPVHFDAAVCPVEALLEQLRTFPLFGGEPLTIADRIDKWKKNACESLAKMIAASLSRSYLLLGAASGKGLSELYQAGKKELVVLDLADEKPWDRKNRLRQWLFKQAAAAGKKMVPQAAEYLLEETALDMQFMRHELDKLISFVGQRPTIEAADALLLCPSAKLDTVWQLAEACIWEEGRSIQIPADLAGLLTLIGPLRFQLQAGLQIAAHLDAGHSPLEIAKSMPNVRGRALDRNIGVARKKGQMYFKRGLIALFEWELALKNGASAPALLGDLFLVKLNHG